MGLKLNRFIDAQLKDHDEVVRELKQGKKTSCWMWYTFPQIKGLGMSDVSKFYEIQSFYELRNFVKHPYLSDNLRECLYILLALPTDNAVKVFGEIDAVKLQSSMTLFAHTRKFKYLAHRVLEKYFDGELDMRSEQIIQSLSK